MDAFSSDKRSRNIVDYGVAIFVATLSTVIPYGLGSLWLWKYFGVTREQFIPADHDCICFWHEVINMIKSPLRGGYYGWQELHSPIGGFGPRGVWLVSLYAFGGRLLGWSSNSPNVLNAIFWALGVFFYILLVRPGRSYLLALVAFCTFFGPLQYGLMRFYPDILNIALSMTIAGLIYRILHDPKDDFYSWSLLFISVVAVLIRKSWISIFPLLMVVYYLKHKVIWSYYYAAVFISAVASLVGLYYFSAPYPFGGTFQSVSLSRLTYSTFLQIIDLYKYSLTFIFRIYREVFYYNVFGLHMLLVSLLAAAIAYWKRNHLETAIFLYVPFSMLFYAFGHMFNGVISFRHIAPFFVVAVFSSLIFTHKKIFVLVLLLNMIMYPAFLQTIRELASEEYSSGAEKNSLEEFGHALITRIVPTGSGFQWCNTIDIDEYSQALLYFPPGSSFNFVRTNELKANKILMAHYFFVKSIDSFLPFVGSTPNLILKTKYGDLYENTSSLCQNKAASNDPD
jgi:hypothetical protein